MMSVDLSRFKVVYGEHVLNAVALDSSDFEANNYPRVDENSILKPKFITVIAINEVGHIVFITDETWRFQFIPIVTGV
jgi:hypothetical protein